MNGRRREYVPGESPEEHDMGAPVLFVSADAGGEVDVSRREEFNSSSEIFSRYCATRRFICYEKGNPKLCF